MPHTRFGRVLLVIVLVAAAVRIAYIEGAKRGPCVRTINGVVTRSESQCLRGDQLYYSATAKRLADGKWFTLDASDPVKPLGATTGPDAAHPPLTVIALTPVSFLSKFPPLSWIDHSRVMQQRYMMALLGTLLVFLIGLLGRAIGGDDAGLWAAGIAAVYPNLWVNDGLVMSETVTNLVLVTLLLLMMRLLRRGEMRIAVWCGIVAGLAMLTRAELIVLVPLLALVLRTRGAVTRDRWLRFGGCVVAVSLLVITPWVVYNNTRFRDPVFISTQDGLTVAGANCRTHYFGNLIGLWGLQPDCVGATAPPGDESQRSHALRNRAWGYTRDHVARWPLVAAARLGRTFGVYRPMDVVAYHQRESRERWVSILGLITFFPLLLLAAFGARRVWRRDRPALWLLVAPMIVVVITTVLTYGQFRFRVVAEPSFVVLAAVAIVSWTRATPTADSSRGAASLAV
jgi:4-amino-4-deoxy-L-arabinose transferase-like glycosyltransferase